MSRLSDVPLTNSLERASVEVAAPNNDKYASPEEMYGWLNRMKPKIRNFLFFISVYKSEICGIQTIDGYARFVVFTKGLLESVEIVDFKADNSKKNDKNLTLFEEHFAKFFEMIKNMPVILEVRCNFRPESPLWHLQDFQTVKKVYRTFPEACFYWTGRQLIGIVKINSDLFKQNLDKALEFENILLDVDYYNSPVDIITYNQMKENLLYWIDHTHIGLNVQSEVAPLLNLILILLPGLSKPPSDKPNKSSTFHNFLTKGLYDPRLLLLIEEFIRPKISQIIYPFYGFPDREYLANSYFPHNWL